MGKLAMIEAFERGLSAVPTALAVTAGIGVEPLPPGRVLSVGTGSSEGPARLLADRPRAGGAAATFMAPSRFFVDDVPPDAEQCALVVFSQSISPNARQVLERASRFRHVVLVTAAPPEDLPDMHVVRHPGVEELEGPTRLVGSACAAMIALKLSGCAADYPLIGPAYEAALREPEPPLDPRAQKLFVALDAGGASLPHLVHKWIAAVRGPLPFACDPLGAAHGALQALTGHRPVVVSFEHGGSQAKDGEREIFDRFFSVAGRMGAISRRLVATLPEPLAFFEHDASLAALALATLREHGEYLQSTWPTGMDKPLYDMGSRPPPAP